ncbi:MAG: YraN family protein [Desulfarculaceae bacterium]|nr:YraN family protein [Desulfarculaceae bacterium]MCF8073336.1 YraN family protein [Desulfarculaceae bacterium]MCF8103228.1 YraN family protein [Desulfarculaceae bacterium]MCF8116612.1 YraN family protein [Desulfarculaceae bacterium]
MTRLGEARGREAEALARGLLERAGLKVVETRCRTKGGELDLVAWDGATLVFVEVKARGSGSHGRAEEAVDRRKRERLTTAAGAYLASLGAAPPPCRFDVVAVEFGSGAPVLRHLPDAFRPGE